MTKLTDNLWIGDSDDEQALDKAPFEITAILNVAQDLQPTCGWDDGVESMQVGLIDGPGNEVVAYCAAVLALVALSRRHDRVLVYDHDGGRALAVALMYLNLVEGKYRADPLSWSHWLTWEERSVKVLTTWYESDQSSSLPIPHPAHAEVFARMPFGVMEAIL